MFVKNVQTSIMNFGSNCSFSSPCKVGYSWLSIEWWIQLDNLNKMSYPLFRFYRCRDNCLIRWNNFPASHTGGDAGFAYLSSWSTSGTKTTETSLPLGTPSCVEGVPFSGVVPKRSCLPMTPVGCCTVCLPCWGHNLWAQFWDQDNWDLTAPGYTFLCGRCAIFRGST